MRYKRKKDRCRVKKEKCMYQKQQPTSLEPAYTNASLLK